MKIMDRYILREFVFALVYCVVSFVFLYIVVDLFNYIDEMMRNRIPAKTIMLYYMTFAPAIFVQIAPMAALLACIYTLSSLKKHNEIAAMMASGVSLWSITMPILFASGLLSLAVFAVNDRVVPRLMPITSEIRGEKINDAETAEKKTVISNIAIFATENRIIYAKSFDTTLNELRDVIIHQHDEKQNLVMKLSAQRAYMENGKWVFENGTSYRLDASGYIIGSPVPFRKKIMELKETPRDFIQRAKQPELMNYRELKIYISKFSTPHSSTTRKLSVDLYYKTSLPFVCLIVIFIASPIAFMIQRGGLLIGLGVSIIIGIVFYGVQAVSLAMGKAGVIPPFLSAWLANVIFLAAGLRLIKRCR